MFKQNATSRTPQTDGKAQSISRCKPLCTMVIRRLVTQGNRHAYFVRRHLYCSHPLSFRGVAMNSKASSKKKIRVGILDDHQGTLDGYAYRLTPYANIDVAASARFGNQLEEMLASNTIDVLLLDVGVPSSEDDPSPYPLLYLLPRLKKNYPAMAIFDHFDA